MPGLMMVGAAALLHGSAYGSELAAGNAMLATASGIVIAPAVLRALGLGAGVLLQALGAKVIEIAAMLLAGSGLVLLATRL